jgi:hypothetical protein
MARLELDRHLLDHPEHFDDEIRGFRDSERYVPTALERMLYELAGHRCTICSAPWMEIHHINELSEGGETTYENLIVLCPNCHTRVHRENVPSKTELRHYKLKQEIAYELPVMSRLAKEEKELISAVAALPDEDQSAFTSRHWKNVLAENENQAVTLYRKEIGFRHLQESGIVSVELEYSIGLEEEGLTAVALNVRLTGKGIKWVRYLKSTERIPA